MKRNLSLFSIAVMAFFATKLNAQYVDLSTGKTVTLVKHNGNGMMYSTETQRPVNIYINPSTSDTFYGRTGEVINGKVVRKANGYSYAGDNAYIYKDGEFQVKTEADSAGYKKVFQKDGDVKVKYNNYKRKEEVDGDVKVKEGGAKTKIEQDGTTKVKDGDFKSKQDKAGNVRIKDDSAKVKINTDGSVKVKDKADDYKGKIKTDGKLKEKEAGTKTKMKVDTTKVKEIE